MLKKLLFFILFVCTSIPSSYAQEKSDSISKKTNPIIFGDLNFGYSRFSEHAFLGGVSLNYQTKKDLFKFRFMQSAYVEKVGLFFGIPISKTSIIYDEYAFMYGKRYVHHHFAYHFAGGISFNTISDEVNNITTSRSFTGFPLEIGMHWFPAKKKIYRIFGVIPVGKPTSFARSAGFKIKANIAKESYVGIALTVGFGMHKRY